jgi:phosphoglycerate dehydrogenase-like enzyme
VIDFRREKFMRVVVWPSPLIRTAVERRLREIAGLDVVMVDAEAAAIAALPDADAMMLPAFHYTPAFARAVREHAKRLRLIQLQTAGYDRLINEKIPSGITIAAVGDSLALVVAEHATMLLLALSRQLPQALALQARRQWDNSLIQRMASLDRKVVAIVGFGAIGRETGRLAKAFGASVVGISRAPQPHPHADEVAPLANLDAVLARADAVVIAIALTDTTRGLFDRARIARMKNGAFLVNIARGAVVDSLALAEALTSGKLAGAGLDVTDPEPPPDDHPLWQAPNLIITPHVAVGGGGMRVVGFIAENFARATRGEAPLGIVTL